MDFRIRIFGMGCLFVFYCIQFVLISYRFNGQISSDNDQSLEGLIGVDILLIITAFTYLVLKMMGLALIDRLIVLFDSILFALSYAWLVLAAPVASDVAGFFVVNFFVATGIFFVDLWEFRQFSATYQEYHRGGRRSTIDLENHEDDGINEMHMNTVVDVENQATPGKA